MTSKFFLQNNEKFFLRPLELADVEKALALCDACVGKNLYTKEEIEESIDSKERFFYLLETETGNCAGYIYFYVTEKDSIADYAKLDTKLFDFVCPDTEKKVGKIQSIGIMEEYRGSHFAGKLLRFALEKLKNTGIATAFIVCWKKGQVVPLESALKECSFEFLSVAHKVWYDYTELQCPYCGGRCKCDAKVYYKKLNRGRLK